VLLATHNAATWLDEQIQSIVAQQDARISIVASDDTSSDATISILEKWQSSGILQLLPALKHRMGNANRNFLRLIRDTPVGDADYFALSDHDDIWCPAKLCRAADVLGKLKADAYSSNVTAFWPDGRTAYLDKAQPQQAFDHLFESAGPGCTFVFTRQRFMELQQWVQSRHDELARLKVHDWLIYAYARERHWLWHIDTYSGLKYRQHGNNEAGANLGGNAARIRFERIKSGRFRAEALAIADAIEAKNEIVTRLRRFSTVDRIWLVLHARQMRRRVRDQLMMMFFFLVMSTGQPV
jgi:rhamnosyltransferase